MSSTDETVSKRPGELKADWLRPVRAYLVLAFQCDRPLERASRYRLYELDEVRIGRGVLDASVEASHEVSQEGQSPRKRLVVRVPDALVSREHARLVRAGDRWILEDKNSKNGVLVNGVAGRSTWLRDGDTFEIGHTFFLYREESHSSEDDVLQEAAPSAQAPDGLTTLLPSFARELGKLARVARTAVPVLLEGDTGTGKELIARGYHHLSGRTGPFVAVNCGALPKNLLETELFGHKKGAFSGAHEDRSGHVRAAHGGTLLLDEIAELPLASQTAFLRVLQEREVVPVGGTRPLQVDFRLVSATHGNLADLAGQGAFREDLYARLAGFHLRIPPLRARREDLGLIIPTILQRTLPEGVILRLSPDAVRAFFKYTWPHNVRELERCLTTAAALARDYIDMDHLPEALRGHLSNAPDAKSGTSGPPPADPSTPPAPPSPSPRDDKQAELVALLHGHRGNVSRVAEALGTSRAQVHRLMDRYGIELDKFRR
ncbi:MAG TPA: sigma 54-interacting transcriptional regulator [Polyangiaceae bacterium]|nr:sigma 54-interacting transcriptional regulator [Polyangiaceae bacterium]